MQAGAAAAEKGFALSPRLQLLLSIAAGAGAANVYYNQPLLRLMAETFHVSVRQVGVIPTMLQLGFAAGVTLIVPLGDTLERRRLIVTMFAATAASLLVTAFAPAYPVLLLASMTLGLTTLVAHLIMPLAMHLAPQGQSGRVAGTIAAGVLTGMLASRTLSGLIGGMFGWRAVYLTGAVLMAALAVVLSKALPYSPPTVRLSYGKLLASVWGVARYRRLWECSVAQGLLFGSFNLFWTTLVFLLASPVYGFGEEVAGLFGLAGLAGIFAAPLAGRAIDRLPFRVIATITIVLSLCGWLVLRLFGQELWGLIAGVLLLDIGIHNSFVNTQQRVFRLDPNARSRLNSIFIMVVFLGAALGTTIGAWAWTHGGWPWVASSGLAMVAVAFLVLLGGPLRESEQRNASAHSEPRR